jgi:hypothetical protein
MGNVPPPRKVTLIKATCRLQVFDVDHLRDWMTIPPDFNEPSELLSPR